MKPNICVFGVGHSGTRIFVKMLAAMGWNAGRLKEVFQENLDVQDINKRLLKAEQVGLDEYGGTLDAIGAPWVIKDPRMVLTLPWWRSRLLKRNCWLLYVTRDKERMKKTYRKHKFHDYRIFGEHLDDLLDRAQDQFEQYPGVKLHVAYEELARAVPLFNQKRAQ